MKIAALINAYNEEASIENTIRNIYEHVDVIVVADGAYKQFPFKKPYSTDKTIEICKKFDKVRLIETKKIWPDQCIKRTAMFDAARDCDYFLKIDADEYITNPEIIRESIKQNADVVWSWVLSDLYAEPIMTARIFKNIKGLHYAGRHHWLYDANNNFVVSDQHINSRYKSIDSPIRIYNLRHERSLDRKKEKMQFVRTRNIDEMSFKKETQVYNRACILLEHPRRAGQPRRPSHVLLSLEKKPKYTTTLMISRPWAVDRYFDNLEKTIIPENTELVVVIDNDHHLMVGRVVDRLNKLRSKFAGIKYYCTYNKKLEEFANVTSRRQRIISNWHILLTEAQGEYILGAEDDSIPPTDGYLKLIETMKKESADFVQGDIVGRWGATIHPAWHVEEKDGLPYKVTTSLQGKGLEEIQGCGWYCFIASTKAMRSVAMSLDGLMPLGPDLRFGYSIYKKGYKLIHDWDVPVIHFTERKDLIPSKVNAEIRTWIKKDNSQWIIE